MFMAMFGSKSFFGLVPENGQGGFIVVHSRLIYVVLSLIAVALTMVIKRGAQANLHDLADRLGFKIKEEFGALSFGTSQMLEGWHDGRLVRIFNHQVLGEKNRPWLAVAAACRMPEGASLHVAPNRWTIRAAFVTRRLSATWEGGKRVTGWDAPKLQSANTGDPAFDDAFIVRTSDPNWAKKILAPKVRQALLAARETTRALTRLSMEGDEVRYSVSDKFNRPDRVEHLVGQMDFVCGLAAQVEASMPQLLNSPAPGLTMRQHSQASVSEPRKRHYLFPIITTVVGVVSLLLFEVVPLFEKKFASSQTQPPRLMQFLFSASHVWHYWWWAPFFVWFGYMKLTQRPTAKLTKTSAEYEN